MHTLYSDGAVLDRPTMYTVQLEAGGKHVLPMGGSEFTNHSCDPNCRVSGGDDGFALGDLVTIRAVAKGEPITFNYLTTEWSMSVAFDCQCGTSKCLGRIAGFKHLEYPQRAAIQHLCSPFIMSQLNVEVPYFTMSGAQWHLEDVACGKQLTASCELGEGTRCLQSLTAL